MSDGQRCPALSSTGDLHGHNQVWDRASATLLAVVDFEESGVTEPDYDLRYLPSIAENLESTLAVMQAYKRVWGRCLASNESWHGTC